MGRDGESTELVPAAPLQGNIARSGFGEQSLERQNSAAHAMAEKAKAEVQARFIVAMQRPRDVDDYRVKLLKTCRRSRFAEVARYKRPVGRDKSGKEKFIEGPSIRFVEAAMAAYGNLRADVNITHDDPERQIVNVVVTDLETNVTHVAESAVEKTMERRSLKPGEKALSNRVNSYGDIVYLLPAPADEVEKKRNATVSKMLRNCGLRVLPRDVTDEAMDVCVAAVQAAVASDPEGEKRRVVDAFAGLNIVPSDLEQYLGQPVAQASPAAIADLRYVYATIRDGEANWRDMVLAAKEARGELGEDDKPSPGAKKAAAALEKKKAKTAAAPPAPPAEAATPPEQLPKK